MPHCSSCRKRWYSSKYGYTIFESAQGWPAIQMSFFGLMRSFAGSLVFSQAFKR